MQYKIPLNYFSLLVCKLLTVFFFLFVQNINAQDFCLTPTEHTINKNYNDNKSSLETNGPFYLKVYAHVIADSEGLGGLSPEEIEMSKSILEEDFAPHNILFVWDCNIDYIANNSWFQGPVSNANANGIFNFNPHSNGIDIYFFPETASPNGGKAYGVGEGSALWISGSAYTGAIPLANTKNISHEMGHCLNLWHTHHGCEAGGTFEPPCVDTDDDGIVDDCPDCETTGDEVCDTPSDPNLFGNVNPTTCEWNEQYSGTFFCPVPGPLSNYNPDEKNIMSYSSTFCEEYFSDGQGLRMRNAILSLPHLQAVIFEEGDNLLLPIDHLNGIVPEGLYQAEYITSIGEIATHTNVIYEASQFVLLSPGFSTENDVIFCGSINNCIVNSNNTNKWDNHLPKKSYRNASLQVFPNPTNGKLTLSYQADVETKTIIEIQDMNRNNVYETQLSNSIGINEQALNIERLSPGIYILILRMNEEVLYQKIIRQ